MASSTTPQSTNKPVPSLLLDPSTNCHQRSRWESHPEPSEPPPLVIHRPRFFVPLHRRPERIIYGYGDASGSGGAGYTDVFMWRIPMGQPTSAADSISRWRTQTAALAHSDESLPRWRSQGGYAPDVVELLRRLQTQELVQDEELEELEIVD
jgi:hypothetical protein